MTSLLDCGSCCELVQLLDSIFCEHLAEFKKTLSGRDLEIFDDRIINEQPLTLQQIGDKYAISRERARQIEARIIKRLKDFVQDKGIIDVDSDNN
jgi:RNA polymerase sigma-32 factor